ncbi:MAG: CheR family methyltransferase [Candidatus Competibacter sp.]|nr:CheR family methyltransferase [Candidatus Competibacter sp.]MDG4582867.1 CheR family methyltransferase [Candidatus Competibacter sp.]
MRILARVESLLTAAIGFDSASTGAASVERAVRERMAAHGLNDEDRYLELLGVADREREALIERVVVPETWFFRDSEPFRVLRRYVVEEWLPGRPSGPLRLLSLPCSTGEEPYSLAMTLFDCGLRPEQWRIDAFDVSGAALIKASRGVYGKNSFRGADLAFRDRYFHRAPEGYLLDEAVRHSVAFSSGNLFDPNFAQTGKTYDIVFFRNLLIYFNREHQKRALAVMDRLLAPSGLLFVGHSEQGPLLDRWFASARYPFAFAYRKHGDERRRPPGGDTAPAVEKRGKPPLDFWSEHLPPARHIADPAPIPPSPAARLEQERLLSPPLDPLASARALADRGQLEEARRLCEATLRIPPLQAESYYLLGLIHEASQRPAEAESCFRKATYLDPDHYPALTHLALTAERYGNASAAQHFRQRARRAEQRRREEVP